MSLQKPPTIRAFTISSFFSRMSESKCRRYFGTSLLCLMLVSLIVCVVVLFVIASVAGRAETWEAQKLPLYNLTVSEYGEPFSEECVLWATVKYRDVKYHWKYNSGNCLFIYDLQHRLNETGVTMYIRVKPSVAISRHDPQLKTEMYLNKLAIVMVVFLVLCCFFGSVGCLLLDWEKCVKTRPVRLPSDESTPLVFPL